ncbi:MAG: sigma 54-interacting transcriptional regulator [Gemmatimonadaceae bacterium]
MNPPITDHDPRPRILITLQDVEPAIRLNGRLEAEGAETTLVSPLDDLRGAIRRAQPEVVLFTADLLDPATQAVLREQLWEGRAVVGLTESADPATIERLRTTGFVEVHPKPVRVDEVAESLWRLVERRRLQAITGLIGESEAIREVLVKVEQIAPVTSTVLIEGESGTGKELVARAIRYLSPRRTKPFIAVNVGALPESLLESELFGHEKGSFTGAAERRLGRFELADGGTIFLDEIGEIPPETQVKLLRVLEEREVVRVGGTIPIKVDVRVIAATNRPLRQHVAEGHFRSDLYYRLNVLTTYLPPLRERRDDIPVLVRRFIQEFSAAHDRPFPGISGEAMQVLMGYPWPGNVRELRNLVESMVVLSPGHEIQPEDLPRQIRDTGDARFLPVHVGPLVRGQEGAQGRELEFIVRSLLELKLQVEEMRRRMDERDGQWAAHGGDGWIGEVTAPGVLPHRGRMDVGERGWSAAVPGIEPPHQPPPPNVVTISPGTRMEDVERQVIEAALRETRGNRRKAAEMLGIGERTLYRKIKEFRLPETTYSPEEQAGADR